MWIGLSQSMGFIVVPGTRIRWRIGLHNRSGSHNMVGMVGIVVSQKSNQLRASTHSPPYINWGPLYYVHLDQIVEVLEYVGGVRWKEVVDWKGIPVVTQ